MKILTLRLFVIFTIVLGGTACERQVEKQVGGREAPATAQLSMLGQPVYRDPGTGSGVTKPEMIEVAPGDVLVGIDWKYWGPDRAFGNALSIVRNCQKSCVTEAKFVTVMLSEPAPSNGGSSHRFTKLSFASENSMWITDI